MDLAFLSGGSRVTSVVRCSSPFDPLPYRAHCLCAENLLVGASFTQTKKLNAQSESELFVGHTSVGQVCPYSPSEVSPSRLSW